MKPYALIIDDFLPDFDRLREFADQVKLADKVNPLNGLTYPDVHEIQYDIGLKPLIESVFGSLIEFRSIVLRFSFHDAGKPYHVHSDSFMEGEYTMIVYLNRPEHCQGGTVLCRHESGTETFKGLPSEIADTWDDSKWSTVMQSPMKTNRALFFPSEYYHYSSPVNGFGSNQYDGRAVLVAFFRLVP